MMAHLPVILGSRFRWRERGVLYLGGGSEEDEMNDPTQQSSDGKWSQYAGRGLNDRTVEALVANGIFEPERLLFMTEAQLKVIPGIGKVAMSNIGVYRARFLR